MTKYITLVHTNCHISCLRKNLTKSNKTPFKKLNDKEILRNT